MVGLCQSVYSLLVLAGRYRHHLASQVFESEVDLLVLGRIERSHTGISVVIVRRLGCARSGMRIDMVQYCKQCF